MHPIARVNFSGSDLIEHISAHVVIKSELFPPQWIVTSANPKKAARAQDRESDVPSRFFDNDVFDAPELFESNVKCRRASHRAGCCQATGRILGVVQSCH